MTHPPCLRLCPAIRVTLALASRVSRLFNGRDIQSEVLARTLSGRALKHAPTAALPVFLDHPSRRRARNACAAPQDEVVICDSPARQPGLETALPISKFRSQAAAQIAH